MSYPHLKLERWPFPVVPDLEFCQFMADRVRLREEIDNLLRSLGRQDASSIHLLWSWFGAGKTHTLYYITNLSLASRNTLGGRLHPVYAEFPKSPRSFVDLYRAFASGLDTDELVDAHMEVSTSPDSTRIMRELLGSSPDLVTALHVLTTGDIRDQAIALRWLRGDQLPAGEYRKVGILQKIGTSEDASRVLAAIVRLFSAAARSQNRPGCRVVWLLDEFQRIEKLRAPVRDEINTGLHSTFNACPTGLSVVLSFSGQPRTELPPWFSPELQDRIGRTRIFVLPPLTSDEALQFVKDLLVRFRSADAPAFFPFSEEACRYIIEDVARIEELKPRAIMHAFDMVLGDAEASIQTGEVGVITPAIAKRALAESISLTVVEADE